MANDLKVTVIVVSYNTRDLLRECLSSLGGVHEVIVVDNASSDGSVEVVVQEFPTVHLIANPTNRGFGAANNQGFDVMTGDLALLLNSDARTIGDAISTLAGVFVDPEVVAAGGKLVYPDGREQPSACSRLTLWAVFCEQLWLEKVFANSRLFSPYWLNRRLAGVEPHEVAQCMGACLMMRPLERFDESFFLYCEDTELCRRLESHGKILYYRRAEFTHRLGASSQSNRWRSVAFYNRGKELYFLIHVGGLASFLCLALDRIGALLRLLAHLLLSIVRPSSRSQVPLFWKVLASPIKGPTPPTT